MQNNLNARLMDQGKWLCATDKRRQINIARSSGKWNRVQQAIESLRSSWASAQSHAHDNLLFPLRSRAMIASKLWAVKAAPLRRNKIVVNLLTLT